MMYFVHEVVAGREPVQIGSDVAALNIVNFAAIRNFDTNMFQPQRPQHAQKRLRTAAGVAWIIHEV